MQTNLADRLRQLRAHAGLTIAEAAKAAGYSKPSGWQQLEDHTRQKGKDYYQLKIARRIAQALVGKGQPPITEQDILALAGMVNSGLLNQNPAGPGPGAAEHRAGRPQHGPGYNEPPPSGFAGRAGHGGPAGFIPVYGHMPGCGHTNVCLDEAHIIAHRPPHNNLAGVKDAFFVCIIGDHMSPRFKPGELAAVHPGRLPQQGDDCLFIDSDNMVRIYEFIGIDETGITVRQWRPEKEITFPTGEYSYLCTILGVEKQSF